ncbi:MAG: type II toxin-antitoxin system VapC family toxin [Armatimonadetes bacterium]|nr:type II toxin-antitoxin system VapC family toxin [Armatimonadota bacterium]
MSWFVFESSAIIKRYVAETGSQWVEEICDLSQGHQIVLCDLCITEVASALSRLQREGRLTTEERDRVYNDFLAHCRNEYVLVPITRQMLEEAGTLCFRHPLRALDAIHLAAALQVARTIRQQGLTITFVSADDALLNSAQVEGLSVENPNWHP